MPDVLKTIVCTFIIPWLVGCKQHEHQTNQVSNQPDHGLKEKVIERGDLEELVKPFVLPEGFYLDTLERIDSARNLSTFIVYVSGGGRMDKLVADDLLRQKSEFIKSLDEKIKEDEAILNTINSDFQAVPVSVYKDYQVTSFLFLVSYYHGGAAHPMTMYCSYNFDNENFKRIFFSDYFSVKSKADTVFMTDLITKAIGREGIFVSDLRQIEFNVEQDTISFNFDDYEIASYGEGTIQGRIHRQELKDRINTTYHPCQPIDFMLLQNKELQDAFFHQRDSVRKVQYPDNDQETEISVDLTREMLMQFLKDIDEPELSQNRRFEKEYEFNIAPGEYSNPEYCKDKIWIEYYPEDCAFRMVITNSFAVEVGDCTGGAQVSYHFTLQSGHISNFHRHEAG